ncbi:unnamed protein product, partial [Prorocentrum cordatum]
MAAVPDDGKAMDLRSNGGAGLVMAMAVQGAAQGAAAGGASRQAIAAAVAAALRATRALLEEIGCEEDAELAMRWQAMEPAMRQQLRGAQPGGAARARRNVGAHVDLGKGVEALRQALAQPQRAAEETTEDRADGAKLEGTTSLDIGEPGVDECEGTDQVIETPEGQLLGEAPPSPQLSAAVGEGSELDVGECEGTGQVVNSAEAQPVPEAPRDVEPGGRGGGGPEEQLMETEVPRAAAGALEDEGLYDGQADGTQVKMQRDRHGVQHRHAPDAGVHDRGAPHVPRPAGADLRSDLPVDGVDGIGAEYGGTLEGKVGESIFSDAVQARVRSVFLFVLRVALLLGVASCPFVFFDWGTGLTCAPRALDIELMPDPCHAARQEQWLESLVKLRSELERELAMALPGGIARTIEDAEYAEDIALSLRRLAEDIREIE